MRRWQNSLYNVSHALDNLWKASNLKLNFTKKLSAGFKKNLIWALQYMYLLKWSFSKYYLSVQHVICKETKMITEWERSHWCLAICIVINAFQKSHEMKSLKAISFLFPIIMNPVQLEVVRKSNSTIQCESLSQSLSPSPNSSCAIS